MNKSTIIAIVLGVLLAGETGIIIGGLHHPRPPERPFGHQDRGGSNPNEGFFGPEGRCQEAFGREGHEGAFSPQGRGMFKQRMVKELGLNDKQVEEIKKIRSAEKDNVVKKLQELNQARRELRDLSEQSGGKVDEAAIRAASSKVAAIGADLAVERAKIYAKISPILTQEQKEKLKQFQNRRDENIEGFLRKAEHGPELGE